MRWRSLTIVICSLSAGCGAAPQHSTEAPSRVEAPRDARWMDLEQHELALDAIMLGVPDCMQACEHLSALCELAEQICELSRTSPEQVSEAQCSEATARCERATQRVATQCECGEPDASGARTQP